MSRKSAKQLQKILDDEVKAMANGQQNRAFEYTGLTKGITPVRTGRLRSSIQPGLPRKSGHSVEIGIWMEHYGKFVDRRRPFIDFYLNTLEQDPFEAVTLGPDRLTSLM